MSGKVRKDVRQSCITLTALVIFVGNNEQKKNERIRNQDDIIQSFLCVSVLISVCLGSS